MLHPEAEQREQQTAVLQQQLGSERAARVVELFGAVRRLGIELRLPLLEIILPGLNNRPPGQLAFISDLLETLAQQNNYLELFEYTLLRIFQRYIEMARGRRYGIAHLCGTGPCGCHSGSKGAGEWPAAPGPELWQQTAPEKLGCRSGCRAGDAAALRAPRSGSHYSRPDSCCAA
jgi:hypothetical protein